MKNLLIIIARSFLFVGRLLRRLKMIIYRPLFRSYGRNFWMDPNGKYSFKNINVGEDVSLGEQPMLIATRSNIRIGNHVMFGPEVTIRGGNHVIDYVGRFMKDIKEEEKRPQDDLDVIIEDDVWVGTRAIILHGVTIHRGAVVAAGAVVCKDVPPYSIVGGVPAKVLRFRWDIETTLKHEEFLYAPEERLPREDLEKWR